MSKLGQLKKRVGFEGDVPRCMNCKHYRQAQIRLSTNSNTFRKNQHCGLHYFGITPNSICNDWRGKDGSVLDEPRTTAQKAADVVKQDQEQLS
ncbi:MULTISPECIES: hypothetical protein [unclassified Comamonas]|uniref:hypothetical protein n=1 Tax=unclassified Comamonas TaxID=2638500 RepID=UPI001FA6FDD3|nr:MULTISPECIES: hypothetical protein [unclassified Comamonas]UNV89419.1 hypothetical protein MP576_17645 [Comamonas sp. 7D-2evo1]UNV97283.1 hypothetical protein MPZ60_08760 [Comamonas sp. 7D-2]UNV99063.1 hypothetical protein MP579_17650 [Comamonas sp. 7D-2evo2]